MTSFHSKVKTWCDDQEDQTVNLSTFPDLFEENEDELLTTLVSDAKSEESPKCNEKELHQKFHLMKEKNKKLKKSILQVMKSLQLDEERKLRFQRCMYFLGARELVYVLHYYYYFLYKKETPKWFVQKYSFIGGIAAYLSIEREELNKEEKAIHQFMSDLNSETCDSGPADLFIECQNKVNEVNCDARYMNRVWRAINTPLKIVSAYLKHGKNFHQNLKTLEWSANETAKPFMLAIDTHLIETFGLDKYKTLRFFRHCEKRPKPSRNSHGYGAKNVKEYHDFLRKTVDKDVASDEDKTGESEEETNENKDITTNVSDGVNIGVASDASDGAANDGEKPHENKKTNENENITFDASDGAHTAGETSDGAANDGEKPHENEENIGVTSIGNDNTSDSDDDHDIGYRTVGRDPNNPTIKAGDVIGWHCTMKE